MAEQGDLGWPESAMMEVGLMVTVPKILAVPSFLDFPLKTLG